MEHHSMVTMAIFFALASENQETCFCPNSRRGASEDTCIRFYYLQGPGSEAVGGYLQFSHGRPGQTSVKVSPPQ